VHHFEAGPSSPRVAHQNRPGDGLRGNFYEQVERRGKNKSISADGRYVVFKSEATDIVCSDTNGNYSDIYVRDMESQVTMRVNVDTNGAQEPSANFASHTISPGGRYVAFTSVSHLTPDIVDGNTGVHLYVRDLQTNTTIGSAVNIHCDCLPALSVSDDGKVVFNTKSSSNSYDSIPYLFDAQAGTTTCLDSNLFDSLFWGGSSISANGRYVYLSGAGRGEGIVLLDLQNGLRVAYFESPDHSYSLIDNVMSSDGRYLAFVSGQWPGFPLDIGRQPTQILLFDRAKEEISRINIDSEGRLQFPGNSPFLSADGRYIAYSAPGSPPYDAHNNQFSWFMTVTTPIAATSPNGRETWKRGRTHTITWYRTLQTGTILIKLYRGTTLAATIAAAAYNNGTYSWTVPSTLAAGTNYKIRIVSNADPTVDDWSDEPFTIN